MNWTKAVPTKPGYYWWRKNEHKSEHIICVYTDIHESIKAENANREMLGLEPISRYSSINEVQLINRVFYCRYSGEYLSDKTTREAVGGEWYGPLMPPE
jgi:hypothetical protein